ncbi:MAG TPA: lipid-binding SYLF domain-containing protein [Rudaea sp.]|nr:lipid-binding SYLF domain-containing protein [Rudaea sp.]HSC11464.1 lipid-binding SYLF domain-containing protein [Rhodanobacteraceae bacterium]
MTKILKICALAMLMAFASSNVWADDDADTIQLFKNAGQSGAFFAKSYGYAVFPTIGKAGLGIGGAHGEGHVYEKGKVIGETKMNQLSIGLQAGGQAYSEIVFFKDKRALDEFTSGNFEFGAGVNAIAITAAAGAETGTSGSSAGASGGKKDAATAGKWHKGMAVFTIAKGGLMYEASISGQKFKFERTGK